MKNFLRKAIKIILKPFGGFARKDVPDSPRKILLLMCNWLGDTFWAMQVIPAIRKRYPDAEIFVGCKPFSMNLLYGLIDSDHIIQLKNIISDRHRELFDYEQYKLEVRNVREHEFDMGLDLTGNRYSCWFMLRAGIKCRVGLDINELSPLYTKCDSGFDHKRHLYLRPWETVAQLFDCRIPESLFSPKSRISEGQLDKQTGIDCDAKIALLAPGAGWAEKQWSPDNFIDCGNYFAANGYSVIVAGSKSEDKLCTSIAEKISGAKFFIEPLEFFIALTQYVDLALTNDSGSAHLLAAAGVNLIAIYLVTDPEQCGPIGENVTVLRRTEATPRTIKDIVAGINS